MGGASQLVIRKKREGLSLVASLVSLWMLAGCATLPAPEAAAFKKIAAASDVGFNGITETEREVLTATAVHQIAAENGTISPHGCVVRAKAPCELAYVFDDGNRISLSQAAPNMRELIGAVSGYGAQMAELAEAKDIDEAVDQAQAAAGAVKSLISVVFPVAGPIAGPILDATKLVVRGKLVEKRRKLMLAVAEQADEPVRAAAEQMSKIAKPLKENMESAAVIDLDSAKLALNEDAPAAKRLAARVEMLERAAARGGASAELRLERAEARLATIRARRVASAETLIRAGNAANTAQRIKPDFMALAKGHAALLKKLRNPSASLEDTMEQLDTFLAVVQAFAGAKG